MGLGSSFLEKVVIPYANSPSTNPIAKVMLFLESASEMLSISGTAPRAITRFAGEGPPDKRPGAAAGLFYSG